MFQNNGRWNWTTIPWLVYRRTTNPAYGSMLWLFQSWGSYSHCLTRIMTTISAWTKWCRWCRRWVSSRTSTDCVRHSSWLTWTVSGHSHLHGIQACILHEFLFSCSAQLCTLMAAFSGLAWCHNILKRTRLRLRILSWHAWFWCHANTENVSLARYLLKRSESGALWVDSELYRWCSMGR